MNLKLLKNCTLFSTLIVLNLLLINNVSALATTVCSNILGNSRPFTAANINEGQLTFASTALNATHKACAGMQSAYGQDHYVLQGWVWNTNLGWVSLGSFDSLNPQSKQDLVEYPSGNAAFSPKSNRGVATGDRAYSSIVSVSNFDSDGFPQGAELQGYWWGDNTGWIRLNCNQYYDTDVNYCGTANHRVVLNRVAGTSNYNLSGFAWSDSVGWINMSDVTLDLGPVTLAINNIEATISSSSEGVIADGRSGHKLRLSFKREGVDITESFFNFIASVNTDATPANDIRICVLANDNRVLDSTVAVNSLPPVQVNDCLSAGIRFGTNLNEFVIGPGNMDNYQLVSGGLESKSTLKSLVPTADGQLVLDRFLVKVGATDYLAQFRTPLSLNYGNPFDISLIVNSNVANQAQCLAAVSNPNPFRLSLAQPIDISICGSFAAIEGVANLNPKIRMQYTYENPSSSLEYYFFKFIRKGSGVGVSGNEYNSFIGTLLNANATQEGINDIGGQPVVDEVEEQLDPFGKLIAREYEKLTALESANLTATDYELVAYAPKTSTPLVFTPSIGQNRFFSDEFKFVVKPVDSYEGQYSVLNSELDSFGVGSVVEYNISPTAVVKRSGPNLNQAFFRIDQLNTSGGFDDRAFTQVSGGGGSASGGTRNLIRDRFIKQVFDLLGGKVPSGCSIGSGASSNSFFRITMRAVQNCLVSADSQVYYLSNSTQNRVVIDYDAIKPLFVNMQESPKTLVLVGIDLVFKESVVDDDKLFSLVMFANNNRKGGNIYVTSNVTDLAGFLFTDRPIYSVESVVAATGINTATNPFNVSGLGVPLNYNLRTATSFYNEITLSGRFFTQNCVGCALSNPPRKGDGSLASIEEAQPYDFNYFRFSSLMVQVGPDPDFPDETIFFDCDGIATGIVYSEQQAESFLCWVPRPGVVTSTLMESRRTDQDKDRKAVNFLYRNPAGVPLFNGL